MKLNSNSSRVYERYGMIEALESRIAPAAVATGALLDNVKFVTVTAGGSQLVKAGEVLSTGAAGGGSYLLYVAQGQVLVHTTDLNSNNQLDSNEITGISVGNGASFVAFTDIHGDVVTDLNPNGTLTDGGRGDILLDANIGSITLRSLATSDFTGTVAQSPIQLVDAHLALSSYSIFGNIYAGSGLGNATDTTSGLHIDTSGSSIQASIYNGGTGEEFYQASMPTIGSIYVGTSATGHAYSFGSSGSSTDVFGNLLAFNPAPGEAGASIYNIGSNAPFSIGTIHAGDGGFNAPGGNIVNVALQGDNTGVYQLIAGNAGSGTTGQAGGSIINFSESGAFLGKVVLQSGNGGTGLVGAGGNAGNIILNPSAPIAINANFVIQYGTGGDGYTHGGAGGGTPSGTFVTPNGQITLPQNLTTTMHTPGSIGSMTPIDFNGDGFTDAVFSTTSPNQVIVALGQYVGGSSFGEFSLDATHYYYLNSPAHVDSITVGNFTGATIPGTNKPALDIAIASGSGSNAGVEVYLSQFNPKTGAFEGFSDPLFSPLPYFGDFYETTTAITKIFAGDFTASYGNHQPAEGLAVLVQETHIYTKIVDSVLIFLTPETNALHPYGSGYFYANFNGNNPAIDLGANSKFSPTHSVFNVTALTAFNPANAGGAYDVILEANLGAKAFGIVDDGSGNPFIGMKTGGSFGKVDTNRTTGSTNITSVDFQVLGMAVVPDPVNPNIADVVALSQTPVDFLVTLQGDGTGMFTVQSGAGTQANLSAGDQSGLTFGGSGSNPVAIVAVPSAANGDPVVAILDYHSGGNVIYTLDIGTVPAIQGSAPGVTPTVAAQPAVPLGMATLADTWVTDSPGYGLNTAEVAFDVYIPHPVANSNIKGSGPGQYGFIEANPLENFPDASELAVSQPSAFLFHDVFFESAPLKEAGYTVIAGNGGNSISGAGGAGGSLGKALIVTGSGATITATGTLSFVLPNDLTYEGDLTLTAGNGGNGFTAAGNGGNLNGISLTYAPGTGELTSVASFFAGSGGESLTSVGGTGGSLSNLYVYSGNEFVAGNGGIGVVGGSGGALNGNLEPGLVTATTNSLSDYLYLYAGNGANGIDGGGNGGGINTFVNDFLPLIGGTGGYLYYQAGNAGNAVAGSGGAGGSIINSSPALADDNLVGDIWLQGGTGGSGLYGGSGGSVSGFSQIATTKNVPTSFTILGGFGGNSTLGTAGAGGNISNIQVAAQGVGLNGVMYNRTIAGGGGNSAGGTGGHGGAITNINTSSTAATAQNVIASGAGGNGLIAGGDGGSVTSATVNAGSGQGAGKVLVIAGDGGSSASVNPVVVKNNPTQTLTNIVYAIGGVDGPGGNGGSILNLTQPTSVNTDVDLIAGNGGATLNHSVAAGNATVDNSGRGGSVENIAVTGSIGNTDPNVAIKSYNDFFAGQTMQQFIDTDILGNFQGSINDSVGNVGLVAGEAGRVEGGIPSSDGVNGSVANITASAIMSIVAGSVDQVALVHDLTNYVSTSGIYGAAKSVSDLGYTGQIVAGVDNYISPDGLIVPTPLPGGGALIDGAILAMNIRTTFGPRDFNGTEG